MAPSAHPRQKFCDCAGCMMTDNWESNTAVGVIKSPSRKHTQVHTLSHTWRDPCLSREFPNLSAPSEEALISQGEDPGVPLPLKDPPTALPHLKHTARFDWR